MLSIMVAGSASSYTGDQVALARGLGIAIAKAGCALVCGATSGLSLVAAEEARKAGSRIIAVSPAADIAEHLDFFGFPAYYPGELLFTGVHSEITWNLCIEQGVAWRPLPNTIELKKQFRLKSRNTISVAISHALIAIGGRIGTINELTIASDYGKPIGIVKEGGGTAELFPELVRSSGKQKAPILVDSPEALVSQILQILQA